MRFFALCVLVAACGRSDLPANQPQRLTASGEVIAEGVESTACGGRFGSEAVFSVKLRAGLTCEMALNGDEVAFTLSSRTESGDDETTSKGTFHTDVIDAAHIEGTYTLIDGRSGHYWVARCPVTGHLLC